MKEKDDFPMGGLIIYCALIFTICVSVNSCKYIGALSRKTELQNKITEFNMRQSGVPIDEQTTTK